MREENKQYSPSNNDESNLYSFHLTLFSDTVIVNDLWVPKTPEGFIKFSNIPQYNFLNIVAKDNKWYAVCQQPAFFKDVPIAEGYESELCDCKLLKISKNDIEFFLLIEKAIPSRNVFHNYSICSDVEIKIGNQSDCEIYYDGPFVSKKHAVILRRKDQWFIKCLDSLYGIYVNGERTNAAQLQLGDIVYLMGLKIIIGQGFLSINSGLGHIQINPRIIQEEVSQWASYYHYNEISTDSSDKYFTPAPRKRRESEETVITVDGPPMSINQAQMPLMLRMGSSMVMGGAAALSGNFMTLITSVLFPFLSSKYSDEQRKKYEELRNTKYTEYLQKKQSEIQDAITCEQVSLNQKFPHLSNAISDNQLLQHLWERRVCDSDFLQLRIGTGKRSLSAKIEYPIKGFQLESDALEDKMYQLVEKKYILEDAPILLSLVNTYICGIQGQKAEIIRFIETLILQIAMYHSYDEVKMVFLGDHEDLEKLDSIKYLPHSWDDMRSIRFVATNEVEAFTVGEYIKGQLEGETDGNTDLTKLLKKRPYYIVFALNKKTFDGHEIFKDILSKDKNPGVSIITAYGSLPKECQQIITLNHESQNISTTMGIDGGEDESFATDSVLKTQTNQVFHTISNISLKKVTQAQTMPKMVTFLDMFNVGRIEQLNPLKRWAENNPIKSLAAPVGVGEDGLPFMLDLHEKRQGPHGLVAGMTGSGKSEFLITYILSMAVNYHPDEVAFVLIDYKGGGLASAFDNPRTGVRLPHLVGTITNLDGNSIQRSLMSIESELVRRQKIFNETTKLTNEGTMNIYTYQKLYRAGKVDKPMPHLFIISDEFAELKQQQPEFMDKLISAARIGRSLGIHLILATQKPSGVVNDQIRSNTKFQVCLRVQERSDSMDMIKRPDAAELTDTGRFYLQVGYNEYFALGQSAWCGADYEPKDVVAIPRDDAISFMDITGQVTLSVKPLVKKITTEKKQGMEVVNYLFDLAKRENLCQKDLWLPPLPEHIDYLSIKHDVAIKKETISFPVGKYDDPSHQKQDIFTIDLISGRNILLVGMNGKSTLLSTMLYHLTLHYTPEDLHFYAMDFSGGQLLAFEKAPHCGGIFTDNNESEIIRLFNFVRHVISERKNLFVQQGVNNYEAYIRIKKLPLIIIVIDNISGLSSVAKGTYNNTLYEYMRESLSYGVRFVVSCSHYNEVFSKTKQEFSTKLTLELKDKFEYYDVLGLKVDVVPSGIKGRGIINLNEKPFLYQCLIVNKEMNDFDRSKYFRETMLSLHEKYCECGIVKKIESIKKESTYEEFCADIDCSARIPIGYYIEDARKISMPFAQLFAMPIWFGNPNGKKTIIKNLIYAAKCSGSKVVIIQKKVDSLFDDKIEGVEIIMPSKDRPQEVLDCIRGNFQPLVEIKRQYCKEKGLPVSGEDFMNTVVPEHRKNSPKVIYLFESIEDFLIDIPSDILKMYISIIEVGKQFNAFYFVCSDMSSGKSCETEPLFRLLCDTNIALFFGGAYDKQRISKGLPMNLMRMTEKEKDCSKCMLKYRDEFYSLWMPAENNVDIAGDLDFASII